MPRVKGGIPHCCCQITHNTTFFLKKRDNISLNPAIYNLPDAYRLDHVPLQSQNDPYCDSFHRAEYSLKDCSFPTSCPIYLFQCVRLKWLCSYSSVILKLNIEDAYLYLTLTYNDYWKTQKLLAWKFLFSIISKPCKRKK